MSIIREFLIALHDYYVPAFLIVFNIPFFFLFLLPLFKKWFRGRCK